MSSAHSMNARKCVHAQKFYPTQAVAHESSKVGGRGKKRGRGKREEETSREAGKTEARRLMERKAVHQNKNIAEELKQGLPTEDFTGRVTLILANNFVTKCRLTMALQHNFFYIPTYFLTHMQC